MKASIAILFLTAVLAGGAAYADCSYPHAPDKIPDGNTASLQEMLDAQKAVKVYNDQVKAYQDCLKLEHDQAVAQIDPKSDPQKLKAQKAELDAIWAKRNDAAMDEVTAVTNRFNEQVRLYKAKAQKSKG